MAAMKNDPVWALEMNGALLTPLMARNALKSNVTWSSYPFLPPTGASGFFADILTGPKWYEKNDNRIRHLHELPDHHGVYALGAFPDYGKTSRRHFRAHLGSLAFNYEAYVWSAKQGEGKKLAVIEEYLTEELRFILVAPEPAVLESLYLAIRGRVAPIAKKGCIQLEFSTKPVISQLTERVASGNETPMALLSANEVGAFPIGVLPYRVALRSEGSDRGVRWHTYDCLWDARIRFRSGTRVYSSEEGKAIGTSLLQAAGFFT